MRRRELSGQRVFRMNKVAHPTVFQQSGSGMGGGGDDWLMRDDDGLFVQ